MPEVMVQVNGQLPQGRHLMFETKINRETTAECKINIRNTCGNYLYIYNFKIFVLKFALFKNPSSYEITDS